MLNLLISFDDPMERLLYGEPDPWLAQFECRHDVGYQHFHNDVNPPTGPGGPEPEPEPEPEGPDSTPQPEPDPPEPPPSPAEIAEWQDRHENGEPSHSLAETVWRAQQAGNGDAAGDGSGRRRAGDGSGNGDAAGDGSGNGGAAGDGSGNGDQRYRASTESSGNKGGGDGSPAAPRHEGTHQEPDNAPYEIGDVVSPFPTSDVEVEVTGRSWNSAANEWEYTGLSLPREVNGQTDPRRRPL